MLKQKENEIPYLLKAQNWEVKILILTKSYKEIVVEIFISVSYVQIRIVKNSLFKVISVLSHILMLGGEING